MTAAREEAARLVIEALRLDRWGRERVARRAGEALTAGVGGFILFGGEAAEVAHLTEELRERAGRPLWIGADLERGAGQQFRGLSELPPPSALATLPDAGEVVEEAGRRTGREAVEVGVPWVLAPVLDLDAERANPIVATRSFSHDPARVAELGRRWIEGCQEAGAIACAKHFPGHGRTREDSHIGLPRVEADVAALEDDLAPFEAVADLVGTLMMAHVSYPALGGEGPASLERGIATDLVRDRLGFEGALATDAMIMGAVGDDDAAAAVRALRAGCDLILYPSDLRRTIGALERAIADDEATAERASEALVRGQTALSRAGTPRPAVDGGEDPTELAIRTITAPPGLLDGWSRTALTQVIPVADDPEVGPPAGREGELGRILAAELESRGWSLLEAGTGAEQCLVVLAATPRGWKGRGGPGRIARERARALAGSSPRGAVVLLGHPRALGELGAPGLCAWSTETLMERAAARWIDRAVGAG